MGRMMVVVAVLAVALVAVADQSDGAIIAYINNGGGNIGYLSPSHSVTYMNNPIGLTASQLSGFDAVVVASNYQFTQAANIGNVLADYADAGGGVVLTQFVFQGGWALSGRIMTEGYSPFTKDPSSSGYRFWSSLGTIHDPSDPLLNGVSLSGVGTGYQANVGLDSDATLVADWASGRHALAYNSLADSSVVGLNFFPGAGTGNTTADYKVLSNAIDLSLTGSPKNGGNVPEPSAVVVWSLLAALGAAYGYRRSRIAR